ncbi:MAG TPA: class I SAM-dependent methyltransferase [Draconibacterium sp.]|nr:class I SAM-dependent methyltransferase [Draconibacterium sp.]
MVETGWFYGGFIDPILVPIRKRINNEVKPGESLIDVACGTGAQVFESASKTSEAIGIDLSQSMINKAVRTKIRKNIENVSFFVNDATNLSRFSESQFEIAIMSLALHQFDPGLHTPILSEMKRVAKKIIIVDYAVPLPQNYSGIGSRVAEFFAGVEHHRNFRKFCSLGGLNEILPENQLEITKSVLFGDGAFQLVVCNSSNGFNAK